MGDSTDPAGDGMMAPDGPRDRKRLGTAVPQPGPGGKGAGRALREEAAVPGGHAGLGGPLGAPGQPPHPGRLGGRMGPGGGWQES